MNNFKLRYFPVENGNKGYLGYGSINTGVLTCQFTVFKNDKFYHGFSINLPSRKDKDGNWVDQAFFNDRDASNAVYAELVKMMGGKPSIPGEAGNNKPASSYSQGVSDIQRQSAPAASSDLFDDDIPF